MIYVCGPGHGGPAVVANTYLEGTYSEVYPNVSQDADGMQKLFKQFSFPGGIPSHVAPETPGSMHEGGELGCAVSHAYGAAFDNPDLLVVAVVGDGGTGSATASVGGNAMVMTVAPATALAALVLPAAAQAADEDTNIWLAQTANVDLGKGAVLWLEAQDVAAHRRRPTSPPPAARR